MRSAHHLRSAAGQVIAHIVVAVMLVATPAPAAQSPATPAAGETTLGFFVVTYRPGPGWQAGIPMRQQALQPHGRYVRGLLDSGRLIAGGGFIGSDGGMMILRAASLADAQAIVAADPAVVSGIFTGTIEHWWPRFRAEGPLPAPQGPPPR